MENNSNNSTITFLSIDGKSFKLPVKISSFLHIFDNLNENQINQISKAPIDTGIHSSLLTIILAYCDQHDYIEPKRLVRPFGNKPFTKVVNYTWEVNLFKNINFDSLCSLITACEKIKCESLLDLCLARLAIWIRDEDKLSLVKILKVDEFNHSDYKNINDIYPWLMKINKDRICELENDD